jgi:Domain of unknown function (DUF4173)
MMRPLLAALAIGITGDLLLRGSEGRLGFTLWVFLLVGTALALTDRAQRERRLLLVGVAAAAFGLVWRDAEILHLIDILSLLCMGALVIWHGSGKRIAELTVVQSVRAAVLAVLTTLGGAPSALRDGLEAAGGSQTTGRHVRALVIGAVIAVPPLAIVAMLLSESDRVFGGFVQNLVDFLSVSATEHVLLALLLTWFAAGWLRAARGEPTGLRVPEVMSPGAPFLTVGVGLFGLVALLALFLGTQARMLFGGAEYLRAAADLTVAEYARDGFFEMVAAAGIVLGTLVAAEWLLAADDAMGRKRFGAVGMVLLVQVSLLLASAIVRMGLYVREFGLSIDRAFALAVMVLVSAALVTVATTTVRDRAGRFAPAMLAVTVAWVMMLNLVNLEGLVVRVNVGRAAAGAPFDARYHAVLSADALPVLRAQASRLSSTDCRALEGAMREHWRARIARLEGADWRQANLPLIRAMGWWAEAGGLGCTRLFME